MMTTSWRLEPTRSTLLYFSCREATAPKKLKDKDQPEENVPKKINPLYTTLYEVSVLRSPPVVHLYKVWISERTI